MERSETTGRGLRIVLIVILVLVMAFVLLGSSVSLNAEVTGNIGVDSERRAEGKIAVLPMDYWPTLDVPIQISNLTITSLEDGKPLAYRGITAEGYINMFEGAGMVRAVGLLTGDELEATDLVAIDDTMVTKDSSCIFLAFSEFPPIDCPIQIDISYRVLGLFPKTETVTHYWDAE